MIAVGFLAGQKKEMLKAMLDDDTHLDSIIKQIEAESQKTQGTHGHDPMVQKQIERMFR